MYSISPVFVFNQRELTAENKNQTVDWLFELSNTEHSALRNAKTIIGIIEASLMYTSKYASSKIASIGLGKIAYMIPFVWSKRTPTHHIHRNIRKKEIYTKSARRERQPQTWS
jgi:hypothetical protein